MREFGASEQSQNWHMTLGLREQRGETTVTQGLQSWDPRRYHSHSAVPAHADTAEINAAE